MPRCFGTVGSVRASTKIQLASASRTRSRSSARRSPTRRRRASHACSDSRGRNPHSARRTPDTSVSSPERMRGRNRRFCSSVPHFSSVLPTILTVTVSLAGPSGTIARAHSSTSTTCSSLVIPPPPYSVGHARPSSPCSCSVRRQPVTNSAASAAGSAPMPGQSAGRCSARNAADLGPERLGLGSRAQVHHGRIPENLTYPSSMEHARRAPRTRKDGHRCTTYPSS